MFINKWILGFFYFSSKRKRLIDILPKLGTNTLHRYFVEHRVLSVGDAKRNSIPFIKTKLVIDDTTICNELYQLTVFPNGDAYPCCSHFCQNEVLKLGNMEEDDINKIMMRYKSNRVIRVLKTYGFKWFIDKCPSCDVEYGNYCEMCYNILQNSAQFCEIFGDFLLQEKK